MISRFDFLAEGKFSLAIDFPDGQNHWLYMCIHWNVLRRELPGPSLLSLAHEKSFFPLPMNDQDNRYCMVTRECR